MKPKEILKHIEEIAAMYNYEGRYKVVYALVCTLPDIELMQYVEKERFPSFYMNLIRKRGLEKRFLSRQKVYVTNSIKQLSKPECTQKSSLRDGIKARYDIVPESYKTAILRCMLNQNTKKERLWAYTRLGRRWVVSFKQIIEHLFEEYKEAGCAYVIVKHFPTEFIYKHRSELASVIGWQWIMSRIGRDYPEVVVREKLSSLDWIYVIVHLDLVNHKSDIEEFLYESIVFTVDSLLRGNKACICPTSLRDMPNVGQSIWALGQMGMSDSIVRFMGYDKSLECQLPNNIDAERQVNMRYEWLCYVYDTIAVEKLGWQTREERGYSFKQYLGTIQRNTELGVNDITPLVLDIESDSAEDLPF